MSWVQSIRREETAVALQDLNLTPLTPLKLQSWTAEITRIRILQSTIMTHTANSEVLIRKHFYRRCQGFLLFLIHLKVSTSCPLLEIFFAIVASCLLIIETDLYFFKSVTMSMTEVNLSSFYTASTLAKCLLGLYHTSVTHQCHQDVFPLNAF